MTLVDYPTAFTEAGARTLALCDLVDDQDFCRQFHPDFSPVGWHLGHVAVVQSRWLLEHAAGHQPLPASVVNTFTPEHNPKANRVNLPPRREVVRFARAVCDRTLAWLTDPCTVPDPRLLASVLQHEHQHAETLAMVLALARDAGTHVGTLAPSWTLDPVASGPAGPRWISLAPCTLVMGSDAPEAYDNERLPHAVTVPAFDLAATPVTREDYAGFMAEGGYTTASHWDPAGWAWVTAQRIAAPRGWDTRAESPDAPVCGLSWHEAAAFARWAGARLPTEAEWERAARGDPRTPVARTHPWGDDPPDSTRACFDRPTHGAVSVHAHPRGATPEGVQGLAGGVWAWTSSWFGPYPGFTPWPYEGYSVPWFTGHRVLRGGSFATRGTMLRSAFRNWYVPTCREVFAGVRLARSV